MPLEKQIFELNEDLIQIELSSNEKRILIDIGWYPSQDVTGNLKAFIVNEGDWENYLFESNIDYKQIENEIELLIKRAQSFLNSKN
jgi:hypothetical protein